MTQNGDKPDTVENDDSSHDPASPPEVDAEVVEAGDAARAENTDQGFDDDDTGQPDQESHSEDADADAAERQRKSTLTPGVILFLVFAGVVVAALAYWFVRSNNQTPVNAARVVTPEIASPVSEPEPVDEPSVATTDIAPAKIANTVSQTPKQVPELPQEKPSQADESEPDGFLPPVRDASAKIENSVADGAKELLLQQTEQQDDNAVSSAPEPETAITFSLESIEEDAVDAETDITLEEPVKDPAMAEEAVSSAVAESATQESPNNDSSNVLSSKIENDVAALKQNFVEETTRLGNALAEAERRNTEQAAEIDTLRNELESALTARDAAIIAELADVRAALAKIQNDDVQAFSAQIKAGFALSALRRVIDKGEPYEAELAALRTADPAVLAVLELHAQTGLVTLDVLKGEFGAAARDGLAAAGDAGGASLWSRARSLVSVRPATPQAGDGPRAIISRAEYALEKGDVETALDELDALSDAPMAAMAPWMTKARHWVDVQVALTSMQTQISDALATSGAGR